MTWLAQEIGTAITSVALMALAVTIAIRQRGWPPAYAVGAYMFGWGARWFLASINDPLGWSYESFWVLAGLFELIAAAGLIALMVMLPGRKPGLWGAVWICAAIVPFVAFRILFDERLHSEGVELLSNIPWTIIMVVHVLASAWWIAVFSGNGRSNVAWLYAGILGYIGINIGENLIQIARDGTLGAGQANVWSLLILTIGWGYHWIRGSTIARNCLLWTLGLVALSMATASLLGYFERIVIGTGLSALILGHAVLRRRVLVMDRAVNWTLRRGTLAAVVVGVFFIVSEGVAQILTESIGLWVGLLVTGLLVMLIAPLQRWVDAATSGATLRAPDEHAKNLYSDAVAYALRDRRIGPREEVYLARLADRLGLSAEEAVHARHEAMTGSPSSSMSESP